MTIFYSAQAGPKVSWATGEIVAQDLDRFGFTFEEKKRLATDILDACSRIMRDRDQGK